MPRRAKNGPPYTDVPGEVYIVVAYPCGMNRSPRMRSQKDYDNVAAWAQFVLQEGGLGGGRLATIECIYAMSTRDEIIIQFSEGTDIIPLLGEHHWVNIIRNWRGPPDDAQSTRVFLYNWRDNGDPSNHNWAENFPKRLPLDSVPVKSPYPAPSWTAPPNSLTNLVLPIPRPPIPPPAPDRVDLPDQGHQLTAPLPTSALTPIPAPPEEEDKSVSRKQPVAPDSTDQATGLFRPYEPPSQFPSHARLSDQQHAETNEASTSRVSPVPPPPKFIKKLDPYELEEDALNALRSPDPVQEDTDLNVKGEDVKPTLLLSIKAEGEMCSLPQVVPPASLGYQPSAELERYISAHLRGVASTASPTVKVEAEPLHHVVPPASLGYQPSAELERCINAHLKAAMTSSSTLGNGSRPTHTQVIVKREYEEDVTALLEERKRIKVEEMQG